MRLPFRLPGNLGLPAGTEESYTTTGPDYDYAIGETAFLSGASDEYPLRRRTAPWRREQVDQSLEAGEQSLTGWWYRAQQSFHSGAGQLYLDINRDDTYATTRFYDSRNVDVWTPGKVTLLPEVLGIAATGVTSLVPFVAGDGADCAIGVSESNLFTVSAGTVYTHSVDPDGNPLLAATTDGSSLYVVTSGATGAVWQAPVPATATSDPVWSKLYDHTATRAVVGWVKQRLVACLDHEVYELVAAGPALPSPLYTHPNPDWVWTAVTETGSAIYCGGYAGPSGAVFRFTLESDGTMPALTAGVVAAQTPAGEQVHSVYGYLGTYVALGTNKGVRVAVSDTEGNLQYGPLVFTTTSAVSGFTARDRFLWATTTAGVQGDSGLYRIDLGRELGDLLFAYATDLPASGDAGACHAVCHLGVSATLAFTTATTVYYSTDNLASSGWLQTSRVRFGTLEGKHFKAVRLRGPAQPGQLAVSVVDAAGSEVSLYTYGVGGSLGNDLSITRPRGAVEFVSLLFSFNCGTDTTTGAELHGYQLKALPGVPRQRVFEVPVLVYDQMKDRNGQVVGHEGRAHQVLQALEDLERGGDTVLFQDFGVNKQYVVVIEEIDFVQKVRPGPEGNKWGGVATITMRTMT